MEYPHASQRFPALHRVAAKMNFCGTHRVMRRGVDSASPETGRCRPVASVPVRSIDVPGPCLPSPSSFAPEVLERRKSPRPVITAAPLAWVAPAPPGSSLESRTPQMATMRAQRELAHGRQRIVEAVDLARQLQQQRNSRRVS